MTLSSDHVDAHRVACCGIGQVYLRSKQVVCTYPGHGTCTRTDHTHTAEQWLQSAPSKSSPYVVVFNTGCTGHECKYIHGCRPTSSPDRKEDVPRVGRCTERIRPGRRRPRTTTFFLRPGLAQRTPTDQSKHGGSLYYLAPDKNRILLKLRRRVNRNLPSQDMVGRNIMKAGNPAVDNAAAVTLGHMPGLGELWPAMLSFSCPLRLSATELSSKWHAQSVHVHQHRCFFL